MICEGFPSPGRGRRPLCAGIAGLPGLAALLTGISAHESGAGIGAIITGAAAIAPTVIILLLTVGAMTAI